MLYLHVWNKWLLLLLKYIDNAQLESDGAASLKSAVTDSKTSWFIIRSIAVMEAVTWWILQFLNIAHYIYLVENWIAYNLVAKLILICGKNHHLHDFNILVIKIYLAQKNYNLKFHPAEKKYSRLDVHNYSDYSVAIIYCT